jgi:hypothetical protein
MEDLTFYYENYKQSLTSTAVIAIIIIGCLINFWAVSIFVALVKKPDVVETFYQWKAANRKAWKYFTFRNH